MPSAEPPSDWTTDYDIFDPAFVRDPYPGDARDPRIAMPDRPHRTVGWLVDADAVRRHRRHRSGARHLHVAQHHRRAAADRPGRRAVRRRGRAADHLRSARTSLASPHDPADVRAAGGRQVRGRHQSVVPPADRRLHRRRTGRCSRRLRPADPRSGHRHDARRAAGDGRRVHLVGAWRAGDRPDRSEGAAREPDEDPRVLPRPSSTTARPTRARTI